ncbi:MAG: diaminopimelate epimerase [Bacillota bacterium]|nr:diaminopimelate epimerase [Bacillota bacterium]
MEYTKIQGLGNDFIIIDNRENIFSEKQLPRISKRLCTRRLSIGADGLMAVENSDIADFKMRFYNSDGSIGEMCGNGARCIVRYACMKNIAKERMKIETTSGIVEGEILTERNVSVKLNSPTSIKLDKKYSYKDKDYDVSYVELGNPPLPHCIIEYSQLAKTSIKEIMDLAKSLRYWKEFPKGANVNFFEVIKDDYILVKTFERGVENFTLACGTGSASTALVVRLKSLLNRDLVHVKVTGGELDVKVVKIGESWDLYLIGDTNTVSEGIVLDEDLKIGDE